MERKWNYHWTKNRIATITGIVIILALVLIYAFAGRVKGENMNIPVFESVPDEVVIYQGNIALVRDELKIYSGKEVKVILPPQAVPGTVEITDAGVRIPKYKYLAKGNADCSSSDQTGNLKNLLTWNSDKTGARNIQLTYMMQGVSWSPVYSMKIINDQSVQFQYRVEIKNNTAASGIAKVKLVSGEIGSPKTGSGMFYRQMSNAQFKASAYDARSEMGYSSGQSIPEIGATKISAHYVYDLPQVSLEKSGVTFVSLFDKKFSADKEYVWVTTTGDRVDIVYTLNNGANEPLAQGLVSVFDKGVFLGSDYIEWTPPGGKGHVTVGSAVDIQAEKTVDIEYDKTRNGRKEYKHKIKLAVKNFSKETRVVKVIDQKYPDGADVQFQVEPTKSGGNNTRMWIVTVPPQGEKSIDYSFYSDSRYTEPYHQYN
jgi:hypothetical protein